jgi:hypothetical protein
MKPIFVSLLLAFCALSNLHAQQLSGRVIDTQNEPVGFANVVLLQSDSTFVGGTVSADDGTFRIALTAEAALVRVSYIGYRERVLAVPASREADMGNIVLDDDALMLQEVVVKANIPVTRIKGDALVTGVQGSVLEKAGTAADVLGKLPGVTLANGALNVFGRGTPTIYINGREVRNAGELERLTSDNIESVEVVTNPGARYDKSVKAVIRIRTKRNSDNGFGFRERAYTSYNSYWRGTTQTNLYYRQNGFDANAMFYYGEGTSWRRGELGNTTYLSDLWENQSVTTEHNRYKSLWADLSLNYVINAKHSVGINYSFGRNPGSLNSQDFVANLQTNGAPFETSDSRLYARSQSASHEANVYYNGTVAQWAIDFNASLMDASTKSPNVTDEVVTSAYGPASERHSIHTFSDVDNRLYAAKLVVERPLWEGTLSFGGEYSHTARRSEYRNTEHVVADVNSRVTEGLAAGFAEYSRTLFETLQLHAGLRYENTGFDYYEGGVYKPGQSRTYSNLFPSASVSFPVGKVQLQVGYSSDVTRPSYSALSDELVYVNRYAYVHGNPFLLPNVTQSVTLKAAYRWLQLYAAFNHNKDEIMTVMNPYEGNPSVAVQTSVNSKSYNNVSFNLSASPTIGVWSPQWNVSLYKQWYTIPLPGNDAGRLVSMNRLSPGLRWNNALRLPQGFLLNAGVTWQGKANRSNITAESAWWATASLYKEVLKGDLSFLLQGNDLFNTQTDRMTLYSGSVQKTTVKNNYKNRSVSLTVIYKFNQKRSKYKGTGAGDEQRGRL